MSSHAPSDAGTAGPSTGESNGQAAPKSIRGQARTKQKRKRVKKTVNHKIFGPIPGIPLSKQWDNRKQCSASGCHAHPVMGIVGSKEHGAYSIALSGGKYEDNVDDGDLILYTGCGGKPEDVNYGASAEQVRDQTFASVGNAALLRSKETQRPVRVVRGPNDKSRWAPLEGCRYDGDYIVETASLVKGKAGHLICQFGLRRIPGQLAIPEIDPAIKQEASKRKRRATRRSRLSAGSSSAAQSLDVASQHALQKSAQLPEGSSLLTSLPENEPSTSGEHAQPLDGANDRAIPWLEREASPTEQDEFLSHYHSDEAVEVLSDDAEDDEVCATPNSAPCGVKSRGVGVDADLDPNVGVGASSSSTTSTPIIPVKRLLEDDAPISPRMPTMVSRDVTPISEGCGGPTSAEAPTKPSEGF
ncbi:hypothetical protein CERSUDRAFT_117990 [Gelatoporia subvermispora B]|uniref:YDG domain-containing protein n=1 Tax=Ceriporiopsis subvermispora (strain B) TaxID=914234 RepID=M2Q942_CERS8|nr:hypothetical protein CERSUDRAFT_117990 [Gelatoporia subvermispora B]